MTRFRLPSRTGALLAALVAPLLALAPAASAQTCPASGSRGPVTSSCYTVNLTGLTTAANGSTTYTWQVTSTCSQALSHISFELPAGVTATSPTTSYTGTRNSFVVENGTANPFHSIKFNTVGEGIKGGQSETFVYTLPAGAPVLSPTRVELKHGTTQIIIPYTVTPAAPPAGDVRMSKSVDRATAAAGDLLTYTLVFANDGPGSAADVVVTDALPSGLAFVSETHPTGWTSTSSGQTIAFTRTGASPSGDAATFTVVARIASGSTGALVNTASTSTTSCETTTANNSGTASTTVTASPPAPTADLSLTKTVTPSAAQVGQAVTFTIAVTNAGPAAATGVVVRDVLPAGLTFASASATQGSYANSTGLWSVGTVAEGTTKTLTLTATVSATGTLVNTAEVQAASPSDPDSTPGNGNPAEDDQASATVTASPAPPTQSADLSIAKAASSVTAAQGDLVTFTVTLRNDGPDTATGVRIEDRLPGGMTFVRFTGATTGTATGPALSWSGLTLAPQASLVLTYEARATAPGTHENVVEVAASAQPDPDSTPGNGNPAEDDHAVAPVTVTGGGNGNGNGGGSSSGGDAGVESDGSMATLLARRLFARREDVAARAVLLAAPTPVAFTVEASQRAGAPYGASAHGEVRLSASGDASSAALRQIVPTTGPQQTPAFDVTPSDLLGVTNATAVVAADYLRPDGLRLGALFGATSPGGVLYDHAKATCDRLGGGRLDYVRTLDVGGRPFALSKLVGPKGAVDYAVTFVAYRLAGGFIVDSRFAASQYGAAPAGTQEVLNLQVWSVSPEYTAEMVTSVLARLSAIAPVEVRQNAEVLPGAYVVDGTYERGSLRLRLRNTTGAPLALTLTGDVAVSETTTGQRRAISHPIAVAPATAEAPIAEVSVPIGAAFDGVFRLRGADTAVLDDIYFADGTWGTNVGAATLTTFTTAPETRTATAGTYLVERGAQIGGTVTDYASLFRFLRPAGAPVDLGAYSALEFTYRSDVPVQVLLEKASVTTWGGKFVANLPANPAGAPVAVRFADLAPAGGQSGRFTADDVTMVAFYALGTRTTARTFTLAVSDLRFTGASTTAGEATPVLTGALALGTPAPHPVREASQLRVALPEAGTARVTVYDLMGRRVATLHDGMLPSGETTLTLDAASLASGTYVVRLETPHGARTRTVLVTR